MERKFLFIVLLGVAILLLGCIQPPTTPQNGTNVTVLREPSNPLETLALCNTPAELKYACNVDSDCICEGAFTGNKIYYNSYCVDKSAIVSDSCGGVGGPRPVACVDYVCTLSYPKQGWTFENCDGLTSERTKTHCKRELVRFMANQHTDETFCNSMKPERLFNQTQCKDLFFDTKAYADKNSTWCERIVDPYDRRICNP